MPRPAARRWVCAQRAISILGGGERGEPGGGGERVVGRGEQHGGGRGEAVLDVGDRGGGDVGDVGRARRGGGEREQGLGPALALAAGDPLKKKKSLLVPAYSSHRALPPNALPAGEDPGRGS